MFSTFDPHTEFIIVLDELLRPLKLTYENIVSGYEDNLSAINCQDYLTFVQTFEIMLKQMGRFLVPYMSTLTKFLLAGVLKLSKIFVNLMSAKADEETVQHQSAIRQAKDVVRTILNLCCSTFKRFPELPGFAQNVYEYAVADQLDRLKVYYVNDRSSLLTLLCDVWPEQDLDSLKSYDQVLTHIFAMLNAPSISYEVVGLIFNLIKKLIGNTLLSKCDLAKGKMGLRALGLKEKASERLQALLASRE